MKAKVSINPRLLSMFGRKMYEGHPAVINVRELLQNSRDACIRKDVEPRITIQVHETKSRTEITCHDNGIGMTAEQIVSDFLQLGGRGDKPEDAVGGFGIAKAAIMSCDDWQVRSLHNFISKDILLAGDDVREDMTFMDGTEVRVVIKKRMFIKDIKMTMAMVLLSDVSVNFTFKFHDMVKYHSSSAGFHSDELYDVHVGDHIYIRATTKPLNLRENSAYHSANVYRLKGLVQFIETWNGDRKTNIIIDFDPLVEPENEQYPFTMSRESLSGSLKDLVKSIIQSHNSEVIASEKIARGVTEKREKAIITISGRKLRGQRRGGKASDNYVDEDDRFLGNSADIGTGLKHTSKNGSNGRVALLIREYNVDRATRVRDAKLLALWQELLVLCASDKEEFGIGITNESWTKAERWDFSGTIYYVLNPELSIKHDLNAPGIVMSMWFIACHEVTHMIQSYHNERFTMIQAQIADETAEAVWANIERLAKIIK